MLTVRTKVGVSQDTNANADLKLQAVVRKRNHPQKPFAFEGALVRAEDTGLEPATHYWATDFESAC